MKNKKGFTLAELLIVVAIIAVLVSIAIPIFNSQLERSRRAVDIHNARSIQSALSVMINSGDIDLTTSTDNEKGVWVIVKKDDSTMNGYNGNFTFFVGANQNVTLFGERKTSIYKIENEQLTNEIKKVFGNNELKSRSTGFNTTIDGINGWDWYIVLYYYENGEYKSRIFSGENNKSNSINNVKKETEIEQWMNRS